MYEIVAGSHSFTASYLYKVFSDKKKSTIPIHRNLLKRVSKLRQILEKHQPFRLYYLSAYGNLHGQDDIREIYNAIVWKFLHVLEASKDLDCRAVVVAGSTSEYGVKTEPMNEDMVLIPTSIYGAAKAAATHLAQAWAIQYDKPIVIYRPSSITGLGEQSIHLIPKIIRSCIDQESMQFIPEPTHDFIYVGDVAKAIDILGENAMDHKGEIFNVSTNKQWTNGQVLEMVEKVSGIKANITGVKELRLFEKSEMWLADNTKMKSLGWKPTKTLKTVLTEMVKDYADRTTEKVR